MGKLEGKVAVVTGASRGIGYQLAKGLAAEGAHVIALARTIGGLEELDDEIKAAGGSATLVPLDLKDFDAIDRLGAAIHERWGKLDILIGNAGQLGDITPVHHLDQKAFDEVMTINVTSNWRLIRSLDPLLRSSDDGRALFMTSSAPRNLRPYWSLYSASKAALEALVKTYAKEVEKTSIRALLVNPGAMRTGMRAKAVPGEDPSTLPEPASLVSDVIRLCSADTTETGLVWDHRKQTFHD